MSTQNKPSTGGTGTRVHHTGTKGGPGTPVLQVGPDSAYTSTDYNNSAIIDFLRPNPPPFVGYDGDRPVAASQEPPPQPNPPLSYEQAVKKILDKVLLGLTTQPELFWPGIKALAQIRFLGDGIEPSAVKVALPFNSTQICDGGLAMIKTVQAVGKKADFLRVDPLDLGKDIAHVLTIRTGLEFVGWIQQVLVNNESVKLNDISNTVDGALKLGGSLIVADGDISQMLGPATAIRKDPTAAAQATRAANQRMKDEAAAAQEQAQAKAKETPPATPATPSDPTKK